MINNQITNQLRLQVCHSDWKVIGASQTAELTITNWIDNATECYYVPKIQDGKSLLSGFSKITLRFYCKIVIFRRNTVVFSKQRLI